jgi:multidrug efflux pump subunit AcrA (membrane-fusion protein)
VLEVERRAARPLTTLAARVGVRLFGPRRRAGLAIAAAAVALLIAAVLPVDDPVSAPARVEGAEQRALSAPVDGYLSRVHVRPGDAVRADQVLVALDDRDLELERLRWRTEAEQADREKRFMSKDRQDRRSSPLNVLRVFPPSY